MKLKVTDNQQLDNQEIRKVINNVKIAFNETIKNEEKKEFLIKLSDYLCNDLIRRGNLINNRIRRCNLINNRKASPVISSSSYL